MTPMQLNWRQVGKQGSCDNPMLPFFECEVGKDKKGVTWLCRAEYRPQSKKFMVWFDNDIVDSNEDKCDIPFLRHDVVYAKDYWKAHQETHFTQFCDYDKIRDVVRRFIEDKKLKR